MLCHLEILAKNRRKRSEIFFANLRRAFKDLIQVKKEFKIISCLCTFNMLSYFYFMKLIKNVFLNTLFFSFSLLCLRPSTQPCGLKALIYLFNVYYNLYLVISFCCFQKWLANLVDYFEPPSAYVKHVCFVNFTQ